MSGDARRRPPARIGRRKWKSQVGTLIAFHEVAEGGACLRVFRSKAQPNEIE